MLKDLQYIYNYYGIECVQDGAHLYNYQCNKRNRIVLFSDYSWSIVLLKFTMLRLLLNRLERIRQNGVVTINDY